MLSLTPLLIVMGTIASLLIIQWALNRVENAHLRQAHEPAPTPSAPPSPEDVSLKKVAPEKAPPEKTPPTPIATPSPETTSKPAAAPKPEVAPTAKAPPAPKAAPKAKAPAKKKATAKSKPKAKSKAAGKAFLPGLTVKGLDKRSTEQLKKLINQGKQVPLANWLAVHRPGIVELDEFLSKNRERFQPFHANTFGATQEDKAREALTAFTIVDRPAGIRFNALSEQERLVLLSFDPNSQRLINQELIAQFGGQMFGECFEFYCTHDKSIARAVPADDPDRKILETLANSSIADKGRHIPLALRLTVMSMEQLRQMCKDLNRELKFASKKELEKQLADIPGSAVLLSMQYKVDDLFILNPLKHELENTLREWRFLKAYAELLISREIPAALSE
jgi:hypothetical protein